MDNLLSRHRNVSILVAVLFAQVLGLAVQVRRDSSGEETRLIRIWAVEAILPFEKSLAWVQNTSGNLFHNYVYLRGVRAENRELKQQIEEMKLQQVRLSEDAGQARRLQLLLGFKEKFIEKTVPAQVIGTSGTEQSRSVYIDKGSADGVRPDQAVITAEGIVGKILHVYDDHSSNMLLVNDPSSGVGVILEKSRIQGVLRGLPNGQLTVEKILSDESIQPGERVLTSGGDQIFPKGLDVGVVASVKPGKDSFFDIRVRPAANLSKLEEVLVITDIREKAPVLDQGGPVRAVDILAQRLPSVPDKPPVDPNTKKTGQNGQGTGTPGKPAGNVAASAVPSGQASKPVPAGTTAELKKPAGTGATAQVNGAKAVGIGTATQGGLKPVTPSPQSSAAAPKSATVKPTSGSTPMTSIKPAVEVPGKKVETPASTQDKSASPATQAKPQTAPVEDKPQ